MVELPSCWWTYKFAAKSLEFMDLLLLCLLALKSKHCTTFKRGEKNQDHIERPQTWSPERVIERWNCGERGRERETVWFENVYEDPGLFLTFLLFKICSPYVFHCLGLKLHRYWLEFCGLFLWPLTQQHNLMVIFGLSQTSLFRSDSSLHLSIICSRVMQYLM